jgi:DNA topoisomerase-1
MRTAAITDRRIARIVQSCRELPGLELFKYLDDDGRRQKVDSDDINEYLRHITGRDVTAKDFRTWAGTILAAVELSQFGVADSERQANKNVVRAIDDVARHLGNTRAVCRKYYVHPAIIEAYLRGEVMPPLPPPPPNGEDKRTGASAALRREEVAVLQTAVGPDDKHRWLVLPQGKSSEDLATSWIDVDNRERTELAEGLLRRGMAG